MTAVLCRHFGLKHIEVAEDIASDTFLKASEHWAVHGIPENPGAWLYVVAKNRAKDYLKRVWLHETKIRDQQTDVVQPEVSFEFNRQLLSDSQLAMIFAVCNPVNPDESQVCLALQILCGFSLEEIANAFLAKPETIKKRLYRARTNLRRDNFPIRELSETQVKQRLDTVLRTLYLLFNEGYFSKTSDKQIRMDLCSEATRLTMLMTENPLTNTPQTNALLALMCYQSSRLGARTNERGEPVLFEEQDKSQWDQSLIDRGNYYLVQATNSAVVSRYHLEAGIAYWHTTPTDQNKWHHILQLYNQLLIIEYSPIAALNRTFAFAKVYGKQAALPEAEKLKLENSNYYHELLGYLYADTDSEKAADHYRAAIKLSRSKAEKQVLRRRINALEQGAVPRGR